MIRSFINNHEDMEMLFVCANGILCFWIDFGRIKEIYLDMCVCVKILFCWVCFLWKNEKLFLGWPRMKISLFFFIVLQEWLHGDWREILKFTKPAVKLLTITLYANYMLFSHFDTFVIYPFHIPFSRSYTFFY